MKALAAFAEGQGGGLPLIERAVERYVSYAADGHEMSDAAAISRWYEARRRR